MGKTSKFSQVMKLEIVKAYLEKVLRSSRVT